MMRKRKSGKKGGGDAAAFPGEEDISPRSNGSGSNGKSANGEDAVSVKDLQSKNYKMAKELVRRFLACFRKRSATQRFSSMQAGSLLLMPPSCYFYCFYRAK